MELSMWVLAASGCKGLIVHGLCLKQLAFIFKCDSKCIRGLWVYTVTLFDCATVIVDRFSRAPKLVITNTDVVERDRVKFRAVWSYTFIFSPRLFITTARNQSVAFVY